MLCTARSARPSSRAYSNSLTNRPFPPISESGRSCILSPVVLTTNNSTEISGYSSSILCFTHSACQSASELPRVAIIKLVCLLSLVEKALDMCQDFTILSPLCFSGNFSSFTGVGLRSNIFDTYSR